MLDTPSYTLCRTPNCRTRPEPGYADRGLCQWCEDIGQEAIAAAYTNWADLQPLIWEKPAGGLAAIGAPFGPTEPINLSADSLAGEIAYTTVLWETVVRDRAGLSPVDDRRHTGDDVRRACSTLRAHYSVLVALPPTDYTDYQRRIWPADGPDAVVALTVLHRRARGQLGITSPVTDLPGVCESCGWPSLTHRDGAEDVRCGRCRATVRWDDYLDAAAILPLGRSA